MSSRCFRKSLIKEFAKEKLEIVLSAPVPAYLSGRPGKAGGRGVGGILPAEPTQFGSDSSEQDSRTSALHPYKFPLIPLKLPPRSKKSLDLRRGFFMVSPQKAAC
jgi:hypothetical protein